MANYIVLSKFTDQGIRAVKDTAKRAKLFRSTAEKMGVTIREIYWTLGRYDVVLTMDAPDDETMASLMMKVGSLGNLKSETLRAFPESQIGSLLTKI